MSEIREIMHEWVCKFHRDVWEVVFPGCKTDADRLIMLNADPQKFLKLVRRLTDRTVVSCFGITSFKPAFADEVKSHCLDLEKSDDVIEAFAALCLRTRIDELRPAKKSKFRR